MHHDNGDNSFNSHFVQLHNSKIHYIDQGDGDPILFLHGVPTSSLLWRNIIPELSHVARCIAPDLIGFGKSDKPDIHYYVQQHIDYITQFIEKLNLKKITLVLHGLGSVIGLYYAATHPENVQGIVFYEAHIHPEIDWNTSLPIQQLVSLVDSKEQVYKAIINDNFLMNKIFPASLSSGLPPEIMAAYQAPFNNPEQRKPLLQYVFDLILDAPHTRIAKLATKYLEYLLASSVPKLLLYSVPGFITSIETITWCKNNFSNLEIIDLGLALHFAQESNPHFFAENILHWYLKNNATRHPHLQFISENLYNHT